MINPLDQEAWLRVAGEWIELGTGCREAGPADAKFQTETLRAGAVQREATALFAPAMIVRRPSGFIEPCQPSKVARPPSGLVGVHEIKHDGYRLMVRRDKEKSRRSKLVRDG